MDPKHLTQLAKIVDLGSMSRAAKYLNVTQPTLTRTMRVIEDRVGAKVLRRGRYGVTPTKIGERLAEQGRAISAQSIAAEEMIDQWRLGLTGELKIGVGPMLASTIMGGFLADTLRQSLPYALRVESGSVGRLVERLIGDELDIVLGPSQLNLHQEALLQETLFKDELAIYAGAKSPFSGCKDLLSPLALKGQTWISTGALSQIFSSTKEFFNQVGLDQEAAIINFSGNTTMAMSLLETSDVLCILPSKLIEVIPQNPNIWRLRINVEMPKRDISIWTAAAKQDRPDVLHFCEKVVKYVAKIGLTNTL